MADRTITAEALITAKDNTGDTFARIGAKFANLGHSAKSSKAVSELCDKLEAATRRLQALDKLQANMAGFAKVRQGFNESKRALEAHARAMKSAEKPTADMERKYTQLQGAVTRAASAFDKQKTAMLASRKAAEALGAPVTKIVAEQEKLRASIQSTTHAIERQAAAEKHKAAADRAAAHAAHAAHRGFGAGVVHGAGHLSGVTGLVSGYGILQAAERGIETYREFDKERRYQQAVMGLTDAQQAPLIKQAIEGGAKTRYNDIQWLEAQRELASRGLNRDQVMAIAGVAANLGTAMDKSLPEAGRAIEGGMFGFGKDTSTYEKALANAKRTADLQVKASKISGMNYEDIVQSYKYGAAAFRMSGLSEEQLLAFAAVGKKANMGGDEMGVAARALSANLMSPTAKAKTAMQTAGIKFSDYQRLGQRDLDVHAFSDNIAQKYGVQLDDKVQAKLKSVFDNRAMVADAAKFMPAVVGVLKDALGGDDAKSKGKIAGEAARYRDAAMSGVDAKALFGALIPAIAKNPALANLLFGSKQGARIRTAVGDPEVFLHKLDELVNHSQGYSEDIAGKRNLGFNAAMDRLSGSLANLQTAFGRALDNGGKGDGGRLTWATKAIAGGMQGFVDVSPALQRLAIEAGAAATAFVGFKALKGMMGGFGLNHSALALEGAAAHLQRAALGLDGKGLLPDAPGLPGKKNLKSTLKRRAWKMLKGAAVVGTVIEAADIAKQYLDESTRDPNGFDPVQGGGDHPPPPPRSFRGPAQPMRRGDRLIGPAPVYGPVRPPPAPPAPPPPLPQPSWWQWFLDSLITTAHAEPKPYNPYGGLRGARGAFALPGPALAPLPQASPLASLASSGPITAIVDKPVDVTGKVTAEVKGQATVSVLVRCEGGTVEKQIASSSGNIKVSTGASMPGAKKAAAGTIST